jgi:hypothetical protein
VGSPLARTLLRLLLVSPALLARPAPVRAADGPTPDERAALARLAQVIDGEVVFGHDGRIQKVVIGNPAPIDLGPGKCARFSADGKRLVVMHDRAVLVMNADGSERTQVVSDARYGSGCPVEFHPNGREILFQRKRRVGRAARLAPGMEQTLTIERLDAHPQLESERLIGESGDAKVPLFVDVSPVDRRDLRPSGEVAARR